MATQIPLLTTIDPFPTRALPQDRFDGTVKRNMDQIELMIDELDFDFIPAVNAISLEVDTKWVQTLEKAAQALESQRQAATSEANALASEQAAALSESHAATSEANAKASENACNDFCTRTEEAAQYVYVVTGIGKATPQFIGLVKPDNTTITVDDGIITAEQIRTARKLKVALGSLTDATFDGSADQEAIPVSGTLAVANGGTGQTTIANIMAGKDASGNTITEHYATKAEMQAALNGAVQVVEELPAVGAQGVFYLIPLTPGSSIYHRYVWEGNGWLNLGPTSLDLSEYSKKVDTIRSLNVSGNKLNFTKDDGTTGTVWTAGTGLAFNNNSLGVTSTAGTSALAWNTEVTLGTVGGFTIKAKLPPNPNADQSALVTQNVSTANENHPILLCYTKDATTNQGALTSMFASGVKVNPSTNTITATTFSGALSGNATTATTLQTTRTINGTNFNGSANITTVNWGTARNISISDSDATNTGTAVSVNGSAAVTLKLPATIKASITGNCSGSSGSCTGNSATASKIQTTPSQGTWVGGARAGGALVNATTTGYGAVWNAPTKNYRVACSTYPSSDDLVYLCYSVTNANITAGTNATNKSLTWNAADGTLTANKFSGALAGNVTGNCSGSSGSCTGNAATASKLGTSNVGNTSQPIYLNGGTATAVSSALRTCYAVVESEAVTNNIFKIASGEMGDAYNGLNVVILISNIMGQNNAIWRICLYNTATAGVFSSGNSVLSDNVGMTPESFIVAYKSNSGGKLQFELYCKITTRYTGYRFTVIQENWRSGQKVGNILTLYNGTTTNGAAAIASGYTALTTSNATVSMDISGNAATATKLATARDINISDSDGTNTGTKISFDGSGNGTIKLPATIKASITGNCSGSSGSCTGNAATATKLATARNISVGGRDFMGSANFDGSGNITLNASLHGMIVNIGNTNNYPFHRIAYTPTITSNYMDYSITLLIDRAYVYAGYGICRIVVRTNNASGGVAASAEVRWLARTGDIAVDSVQVGFVNTAQATYADVFYKSNGSYMSAHIRVLAHSNARTSAIGTRGFSLTASSTEVNSTTTSDPKTSVESYATIAAAGTALHNQAYTSTITAVDAGIVNNVSGTVAIANGGTGATTRLNALKALTNENVSTNAQYFLTVTDGWGKGGFTSVADVKTVLGLKSAAYTESSEYATSGHTHSYLPLSGGTITGNILASNTEFQAKATGVTRGSSTTAVYYFPFHIVDNAGKNACGIYYEYLANKTTKTHVMCYKGTTNDNTWSSIGVGYDNSGNVFTWAPTPATADNSTKIATTAFVKAQGYITSSGSITGNAATATSAGKWTTARNFTIKDSSSTNAGTAVSVNGTGNVTLLLPATIKASITGNCSGSSGSCTGNAASATKLATARSLWGNSFNGSADINGNIEAKSFLDFNRGTTADYKCRIYAEGDNTLIFGVNSASKFVMQQTVWRPYADKAASLGSASERWNVVYAGTGSINTSDERMKNSISNIDDTLLDAWGDIEYKIFKFNDSVEEKNDAARYHSGVVAQAIGRKLSAKGIDPTKYGFYCYDEWGDQYITDVIKKTVDGERVEEKVKVLATKAGNRYSIRYEELFSIEAAYMRRYTKRLEARISELEKLLNVA